MIQPLEYEVIYLKSEIFKEFNNINADGYFKVDRSKCNKEAKQFPIYWSKVIVLIVNVWNSLSSRVVDCETVTTSKNILNKYQDRNSHLLHYPLFSMFVWIVTDFYHNVVWGSWLVVSSEDSWLFPDTSLNW